MLLRSIGNANHKNPTRDSIGHGPIAQPLGCNAGPGLLQRNSGSSSSLEPKTGSLEIVGQLEPR